jgi:hypothetical protein
MHEPHVASSFGHDGEDGRHVAAGGITGNRNAKGVESFGLSAFVDPSSRGLALLDLYRIPDLRCPGVLDEGDNTTGSTPSAPGGLINLTGTSPKSLGTVTQDSSTSGSRTGAAWPPSRNPRASTIGISLRAGPFENASTSASAGFSRL